MSVWVLLMTAAPGWQSAAEPFGVSSASAILYEPERGLVLYEKDIHTPRSMASTTKVMTGLLALEQGDLDREITVPAEAVRVEGSALGLRGGDTISMRDLVIGLLLLSSLSSSVTNPVLASVINWVSIYNRFQEFNYGVCSVESLIYYISITVIFLFLTVRVLEKRRWS